MLKKLLVIICQFFKKIRSKSTIKSNLHIPPEEVNTTTSQIKPRSIKYVEILENGCCKIKLIHTTSSMHKDSIYEQGLVPKAYSKIDVLNIIRTLTDKDPDYLFDEIQKISATSLLINTRINREPAIYLLPASNISYLKSAAKNSVHGGGEIHKAIRTSLESILGVDIPPLHASAHPIVCLVTLDAVLAGDDGYRFYDGKEFSEIHYFQTQKEFKINYIIPPEKIEILTLEEFQKINVV